MKSERETMAINYMLDALVIAAAQCCWTVELKFEPLTEMVHCIIDGREMPDISVVGDSPSSAMRDVMRGILEATT